MKKARNFNGGRAALTVVAAFACFAAFAPNVWAQNGGAIPAAVETERGGKATLGVDASELDFYNDFNDASAGQVAQPTVKGETGQSTRSTAAGGVAQVAQPAVKGEAWQAARSTAAGDVAQVAQPAVKGEAGQTARSTAAGGVAQVAQPTVKGEAGKSTRVGGVANDAVNSAEEIVFDGDGDKTNFWAQGPSGWFGPESVATSLKTILTFSILAVAPAILLATTSFVRISVVLSLLRQGIGAGQVPSNQTIAALAVFLSLLIMAPVWAEVYETAVVPYSEGQISNAEAFQRGQAPIRTFLWRQIEKTGNAETIAVFTQFIPGKENPEFYEDVPWRALAPAFLLSELKTAFLIGFQILIPFLIIDVVVSSVLVSTGMMMLPPTVVSLPFKLALFVLSDGWTLVVKSLLESFAWSGGA